MNRCFPVLAFWICVTACSNHGNRDADLRALRKLQRLEAYLRSPFVIEYWPVRPGEQGTNILSKDLWNVLSQAPIPKSGLEADSRRGWYDHWGNPYVIYLVASNTGEKLEDAIGIEIRSLGANGVDEAGQGDDLTTRWGLMAKKYGNSKAVEKNISSRSSEEHEGQ